MTDPAAPLEWTSWPVRDDWPRSLFLSLLLAGILALLFAGYGHLGWIAVALLFLSLARYYVPTRYVLDGEGVSVTFAGGCRRRRWSDFRKFYAHSVGVHLSPFEKPSPLDPFRGTFLRFARGNRDAVIAHLERAGVRRAVREAKGGAPAERG